MAADWLYVYPVRADWYRKNYSLFIMKVKHRGSTGETVSEAFTLIELLVVIGVIGILASLLLPVLSKSKLRAKDAQCLNNLRQLAIANTVYVDSSKGVCPPYGNWMAELLRYQNTVLPLRFCPMAAETNTVEWGTIDKAWSWLPKFSSNRWDGSYCMNGWLYSNRIKMMDADQVTNVFWKESNIRKPSQTPLFMDGNWLDCWPKASDRPAKNLYEGTRTPRGIVAVNGGASMGRLTIPRHGGFAPGEAPRDFDAKEKLPGGINVACFDGHVEFSKLESLWDFYWHANWVPPDTRPQ